ncbi:hypothetical protein Hdeb2414_s0002g00068531 [Helianthus debilis subsp. tardiflorus]
MDGEVIPTKLAETGGRRSGDAPSRAARGIGRRKAGGAWGRVGRQTAVRFEGFCRSGNCEHDGGGVC